MKKLLLVALFIAAFTGCSAIPGIRPAPAGYSATNQAALPTLTATPNGVAVQPTTDANQVSFNDALATAQKSADETSTATVPTATLFSNQDLANAMTATQASKPVVLVPATATPVPSNTPVVVQPTNTLAPSPSPMPATATVPPTLTSMPPTPLPTSTPVPAVVATAQPNVVWTPLQVSPDVLPVDMGNGLTGQMVKSTSHAMTTANGRYEAIPAQPGNATDLGWCKPTQATCPPHLLNIYVGVPQGEENNVSVDMDISYRLMIVNNTDHVIPMNIVIKYNALPLEANETLMSDWAAQCKNIGCAVMIMNKDNSDPIGSGYFEGKPFQFGPDCWDCLADTQGPNEMLNFSDPRITQFGTQTPPNAGSSLKPRGIVFPFKAPNIDPQMIKSISLVLQPHQKVVALVGAYKDTSAAS